MLAVMIVVKITKSLVKTNKSNVLNTVVAEFSRAEKNGSFEMFEAIGNV